MFGRKKIRDQDRREPIGSPPPPRPGGLPIAIEYRALAASERSNLLHEWDVLRSIPGEERTSSQRGRLVALVETLWPETQRNPMNGIRRVPNRHG